jgi:hypothetical protein
MKTKRVPKKKKKKDEYVDYLSNYQLLEKNIPVWSSLSRWLVIIAYYENYISLSPALPIEILFVLLLITNSSEQNS